MFNNLHKSLMLCKITKGVKKAFTKSHEVKTATIQNVSNNFLVTKLGNQIDLDILKMSKEFFNVLPMPKNVMSNQLDIETDNSIKRNKTGVVSLKKEANITKV